MTVVALAQRPPTFADPYQFGRAVLRRQRWRRQKEMRDSIFANRRTHLRSGNGVGKSHELASTIIEWALAKRRRRVACVGPTHNQVKRGLWQELRLAHAAMVSTLGVPIGEMGVEGWTIGDGWDANILSVDNISAAQGLRGIETLIVVDEAQGVQDDMLWDALESLMTAEGSRMVVSGNPLFPAGRYYEEHRREGWNAIRIDCHEHPNVVLGREVIPGAVTQLWIDEKRRSWGEDDARWIARVLGEFPDDSAKTLITRAMIDKARNPTATDGRHMGLDLADTGDLNVASLFVDRRLVEVQSWSGIDLMATAGRAIRLAREWQVPWPNLHVDICGLGRGVVSRMREQGYDVDGVDFGEGQQNDWSGVVGDEKFLNRRAELHWVMRCLLRESQIEIPAKFADTIKDLTNVELLPPDSAGRVRLEEKKAVKKKIGRSPDFGDSAVLALSRMGVNVGVRWL